MEGCEYKSSKDIGGKDFRLMLVDRAVNGWDEYRGTGTNAKERFATSSIQNLLNNPAALTHGKDRFEWIAVDAEHNIARNCVRGGIDKEPCAVGDYCLSRPFWGYSKEIWDALYGAATSWQERWYQKIVWINLCKMRLRSASGCGERCRCRCFWLTFPAQMGQPVRFFAFVQFEIAVRQTCPSGQSHQTFCREWQVTASGVSPSFFA